MLQATEHFLQRRIQLDVGIEIDGLFEPALVEQMAKRERLHGRVELDDAVPQLHIANKVDAEIVTGDHVGGDVEIAETVQHVRKDDEARDVRVEAPDGLHQRRCEVGRDDRKDC
jgi:hypothetical protein